MIMFLKCLPSIKDTMAQKAARHREIEKIARHLQHHTVSMWNAAGFVRLSAAELRDKTNFIFIGIREERTRAADEMVNIAEMYLRNTGNNGFLVVGVRVEHKSIKGYDGDEVQLLLNPNNASKGESVLVLFAANKWNADFFTHELLPFAQFSTRKPLEESLRETVPGTGYQQTEDNRARIPWLSILTSVGVVNVNLQTKTTVFRAQNGAICSYSSQDRQILVSRKPIVYREDVPNAFVSAISAMRQRTSATREIAERFIEDYNGLRKKGPAKEQAGVDGRRLLTASEGVFSILENGRIIYTSNAGGFACEYVPEANMLFLDGRKIRKHSDIPREFLRAVSETTELGYSLRNDIADAVLLCIPSHIRNRVGANAISWCLRHKDTIS